MASVPPSPSPSIPPSASPAKPLPESPTYLSKTTAHINHINRLISTTANLDLTLSTVGYTFAFLSTILPLPTPTSSSPAFRKTTSIQNPTLTSPLRLPSLLHLRAHFSNASPRLEILSSLISETRTLLRLFGLFSLFPAIASTLSALLSSDNSPSSPHDSSSKPVSDTLSTLLARLKLLAATIFQVCENIAFLGDKGVLSIAEKRRGRIWNLCLRAWAAYVFLELGRLAREYHMQYHSSPAVKALDIHKEEQSEDNSSNEYPIPSPVPADQLSPSEQLIPQPSLTPEQSTSTIDDETKNHNQALWLRRTISNAAYAPMTLHYSLPNGLLNPALVNLCGIIASSVGLAEAWRMTTV